MRIPFKSWERGVQFARSHAAGAGFSGVSASSRGRFSPATGEEGGFDSWLMACGGLQQQGRPPSARCQLGVFGFRSRPNFLHLVSSPAGKVAIDDIYGWCGDGASRRAN